MAISKTQPMREAEIELVDAVNGTLDDISELTGALGQEIANRTQADTALGTRIDAEILARQQADTALANRLDAAEDDIDTLQINVAAFPVFEFGATEGDELQAGTSVGIDIEFAAAKEAIPYVLISVESDEAEGYIAECSGVISNITLNGFSVRLHNDSTDDATIVVNWLAIGE